MQLGRPRVQLSSDAGLVLAIHNPEVVYERRRARLAGREHRRMPDGSIVAVLGPNGRPSPCCESRRRLAAAGPPWQGHQGHDQSSRAAAPRVPGHWEGDLLIGLERSAIGTLVERTTRFTMLIHLPSRGRLPIPSTRADNGPALAGYGAVTMKNALASTMTTLPERLRRSLTWDRGKGCPQHAAFKIETESRSISATKQPLAARDEREHQRTAATVLPERHRPVALERRGDRNRRHHPQRPAAQVLGAGRHQRRVFDEHLRLYGRLVLLRSIEPGQFAAAALRRTSRRASVPSLPSDRSGYLRQHAGRTGSTGSTRPSSSAAPGRDPGRRSRERFTSPDRGSDRFRRPETSHSGAEGSVLAQDIPDRMSQDMADTIHRRWSASA